MPRQVMNLAGHSLFSNDAGLRLLTGNFFDIRPKLCFHSSETLFVFIIMFIFTSEIYIVKAKIYILTFAIYILRLAIKF